MIVSTVQQPHPPEAGDWLSSIDEVSMDEIPPPPPYERNSLKSVGSTGSTLSMGGSSPSFSSKGGLRRSGSQRSTLRQSVSPAIGAKHWPEMEILDSVEEKTKKKKIEESLSMNKLRFDALGLYGRENEMEQLKTCFGRMKDGESGLEMFLLHGRSGCGKTALAQSFGEYITTKQNGSFAMGKYDLTLRDDPYSAIISACEALCNSFVNNLGKDLFQKLHVAMKEQLDLLDLVLLQNFIPAFTAIVAVSRQQRHSLDLESLRPDDKKIRLQMAIQKFLLLSSLVSSCTVIFLDDLQWADIASLELLKSLALDKDMKKLMIMGSYRSNDVDDSHQLSETLQKMKQESNLRITDITLKDLEVGDISRYLSDLLTLPVSPQVTELACLCLRKTHGNPVFLRMFLSLLAEDNLLTFNVGLLQWSWDISTVEKSAAATENVSTMIRERIQRSSSLDLAELLVFAACLGSVFDKNHLELVWKDCHKRKDDDRGEHDKFLALLEEAVDLQSLEKSGDSQYKFFHDSVKEAVISLVSDSVFKDTQHQVGLALLKSLDEDSHMLFVVANLLNENREPDADVAKLNLRAATKAKEMSAFSSAAAYSKNGIQKLSFRMWELHPRLALDLHSTGAESERGLGNITTARNYCHSVFVREDLTLLDKMRCHEVMITILTQEEEWTKACAYCLDLLDSMGFGLPRGKFGRIARMIGFLKKLKKGSVLPQEDDINNMELMADPIQSYAMRLLEEVGSSSYYGGDKIMYILALSERLKWTLEYGLHANSPGAMASIAGVCMHGLGDWVKARSVTRISRVAMTRIHHLGSLPKETNALWRLQFFIYSFTDPSISLIRQLAELYKTGMVEGDIDSAVRALSLFLHALLFCGRELHSAEADCAPFISQMEKLGFEKWGCQGRQVWQCILNLTGGSTNTTTLEGIAYVKEDDPADAFTKKHTNLFFVRLLCTYFGEYVTGAENCIKYGKKFLKTFPGCYFGVDPFNQAILLYGAARITKKTRYRKQADRMRSIVQDYVKKAAPNHVHMLSILDAEHAAIRGTNMCEVKKLYELAIVKSARSGYMHNSALAEERYADYLFLEGDEDATYHLKEAIRRYLEWGAIRKVQILREKYAQILSGESSSAFGLTAASGRTARRASMRWIPSII